MSVYLRLVVGPVVVCDIELFATRPAGTGAADPPPQLNGGSGTLVYPDDVSDRPFGFAGPTA